MIHQGAAVVRPSGSSTARDYSREGGIAPCGALARPPPAEGRTHRKVSQAGGAGHGTLGTAGAGRERRERPAAGRTHPAPRRLVGGSSSTGCAQDTPSGWHNTLHGVLHRYRKEGRHAPIPSSPGHSHGASPPPTAAAPPALPFGKLRAAVAVRMPRTSVTCLAGVGAGREERGHGVTPPQTSPSDPRRDGQPGGKRAQARPPFGGVSARPRCLQ